MTKVVRCRDVGMECDYVARAETDDAVMRDVAAHAREAHGLRETPDEIVAKARAAMREE